VHVIHMSDYATSRYLVFLAEDSTAGNTMLDTTEVLEHHQSYDSVKIIYTNNARHVITTSPATSSNTAST